MKWRQKECLIELPEGEKRIEVEAPEFWSDLAIDIAASRYFRKAGVPDSGYEFSVRQLVDRVLRGFHARAKSTPLLFTSSSEINDFITNLQSAILSQEAAFNSPVWFNFGLFDAYGIKGDGESFRYDVSNQKVEMVTALYEFPQTSACFIQSLDDDLLSIFDLAKKEAKVFKFGSGTGTNFSKLRGVGERLENGGRSSGVMSFLDVLDKGAGAVKSGGLARRAAKMVCLDSDHPEIEAFIDWKSHEEKKARVLVAAGFSSGMTGEAYRTVSGQNSNNSVRVSDKFMQAVVENSEWNLTSRLNGEVVKKVSAKKIFGQIADRAWECGDPGIQFHDTIQKWHTCPGAGDINASNPCSEFMFVDDSACNLASINLLKFLDDEGEFRVEEFISLITNLIFAQDLLVSGSSFPTAEIALNSYELRPLGIGFANLGALLMSMGVSYDSEVARAWGASIAALLSGTGYLASITMAKKLGAFKRFSENKESMKKVMDLHRNSLGGIQRSLIPNELYRRLELIWDRVVSDGSKFGFRNAQISAIAPTGTIGLVMDCSTMGVEPEFALVKKKFLMEGKEIRLVNSSLRRGLSVLGYRDSNIENILKSLELGTPIDGSGIESHHLNVFDCAVGARPLSWISQLKMVSVIQPFISGAISKTLNLPNKTTPQEIEAIYLEAWKLGLKSLAIYRDHSKVFQPLVT